MTTHTSPSPGALHVVRVDDLTTLEDHAAAWDALAVATEAPEPLPMTTHAWIACHLEHRPDPDSTWACYLAYDGEQLVGVLPLIRSRHRVFGNWRPVLRVPSDFHTRDGDVALATGREEEALSALLDAVRREEGPYLQLNLGGLRAGSPTLSALAPAHRGGVRIEADLVARVLEVGDWKEYESSLHSKFRRNLRRARSRCDDAGAEFRVLEGAAADPGLLQRFAELEAGGWKGREGTAIFSKPSSRAFYEALTRRLAARGWLVWDILEIDDRWIAASLGVRFGPSLVMLRTAYDEGERNLSPGGVLLASILQRTFERQDARVLDFLSDFAWFDGWNMGHSIYHSAHLYPRGVLPLLFGATPAALRPLAKRVLRRRTTDEESTT